MSKEFSKRIHGDGHLIMNSSFYSPINKKETPHYLNALTIILNKSEIFMPIEQKDPKLPDVLLALKQRFMIAFSNGCPWPEKAISEYLSSQQKLPTSLDELTTQINESGRVDGKRSFLFQSLINYSSESLKKELLSYHPWNPLEKQENHNLPEDITEPNGKGAYGLANDSPFFEVIVPLYKYIDDGKPGTNEARYFAVSDYMEKVAGKAKSIKELVAETNKFLSNPKNYLKPYLAETKKT